MTKIQTAPKTLTIALGRFEPSQASNGAPLAPQTAIKSVLRALWRVVTPQFCAVAKTPPMAGPHSKLMFQRASASARAINAPLKFVRGLAETNWSILL